MDQGKREKRISVLQELVAKACLFRYGEMIRKVPEAELLTELKKEIDIIVDSYEKTGVIPGRKQH